jgi:hypothetical protein
VAGATPFPKVGWPDHPIFGQGVASATPYRPYGGGRSHPRPLGVVRPPQKAPPQKKRGGGMGFGLWGWPDHPLGHGGGRSHHLRPAGGVRSHPQALGGGPATPKGQNPFPPPPPFFWAFWGGRTTPKGLGWLRPPPYGRYGVASPYGGGRSHPLAKNGVVRPPHFWEGGGSSHPDSLFSFFLFLNFLLFSKKKKKKKKKPKMQNYAVLPKTASFWSGRYNGHI